MRWLRDAFRVRPSARPTRPAEVVLTVRPLVTVPSSHIVDNDRVTA